MSQQTTLIKNDFEVNNRAWIGGDQITVLEDSVKYDIENFGKIPNKLGETKFYAVVIHNQQNPISRENIPIDRFKSSPLTVVMPNQKMSIFFTDEIMIGIEDAKNSEGVFYLMIIMTYPYGDNKIGEYGYVGKYNPESNDFSMIDSWAK